LKSTNGLQKSPEMYEEGIAARVRWLESHFLRSEEDVMWEWGGLLLSWSGTRVVDSDMRISLLYIGVEEDFSSEVK